MGGVVEGRSGGKDLCALLQEHKGNLIALCVYVWWGGGGGMTV